MRNAGKRVGVFGGTFDPVHIGHLLIAQTAIDTLNLDRLLFVPAALPPHKQDRTPTPAPLRCQLIEAAIADHPQFMLSTIEIERRGVSYTVDTLAALKQQSAFHRASLFLIIGADNFQSFPTWREPQIILQYATLAVYPRFDVDLESLHLPFEGKVEFFQAPRLEISSSAIRTMVRTGRSIRYFVPDPVRERIAQLGLYRSELQEAGEDE